MSMDRSADDLILFSYLVESGSYTATAQVLGLQKSYVSRRIAALEAMLGLQLIERSSRSLRVTELGQRVYERARVIRNTRDETFDLVDAHLDSPSGALSVVCPTLLAELLIGDLAIQFAAANPRVQLTFDVLTSPPGGYLEAYDLVITPHAGALPDSNQVARRLFTSGYALVASPAFLAGRTTDDLAALQGSPAVGWWQTHPGERWELTDVAGQTHSLAVQSALAGNDLGTALRAAKAGLGLARLPEHHVAAPLSTGELVRVLPDHRLTAISVHVLYSSRRVLTAAGRAFIAAMEARVAERGLR